MVMIETGVPTASLAARKHAHGRWKVVAAAAAGLLVAAGCGGSASKAAAKHKLDSSCHVAPFNAANFVDPTLDTNPFHPLKPGLQWVRSGTTEVGKRVVPHEIITTMTDVSRVIDGVQTIGMLDESTDSGEISQVGMDYMALDKDGNVWILGGYTEDYQAGAYTNVDNAFLGQSRRTTVGILSPRDVTLQTPTWCIGAAPDEKPSVGTPTAVATRRCVTFGCFENVRVVQEGNVGAPDNENKYYAPGVGVIDNIPLQASLHKDRFQLENFTTLTAEGLARQSQTLLNLEAHGLETSPEVFKDAPSSRRLG